MENLSILVSTDNGTFEEFYLFLNNCLIIFPIFQYVTLTILQYVESNYFIFF
jgi:hypothetical protein